MTSYCNYAILYDVIIYYIRPSCYIEKLLLIFTKIGHFQDEKWPIFDVPHFFIPHIPPCTKNPILNVHNHQCSEIIR